MTSPVLPPAHPRTSEPPVGGRRRFLASVGAVGALGLLAACGTDASGGGSTTEQSRVHTDALGNEVSIPTSPQRILAMHLILGAGLLALQAPVAAVSAGLSDGTWPEAYEGFDVSDLTDVGEFSKPDFEKILQVAPDLIVLGAYAGKSLKYDETLVERLRQLAPVVYLDYGAAEGESLPGDRVRAFAEAVAADTVLVDQQQAEYEGLVAEISTLLGPDPSEVAVGYLSFHPQNFTYGTPYQVVPLIQVMLAAGARWAYEKEPSEQASLETLRDVRADVLLAANYGEENLAGNSLFAAHPTVAAGQAIMTERRFSLALASYRYFIGAAAFLRDQLTALAQPIRSDIA